MAPTAPYVTSVTFEDFRVLRRTTLPLDRYTLLIGPNGSGKSTVLKGLELLQSLSQRSLHLSYLTALRSLGSEPQSVPCVSADLRACLEGAVAVVKATSLADTRVTGQVRLGVSGPHDDRVIRPVIARLFAGLKAYSFNAIELAAAHPLVHGAQLGRGGQNLVGVLDRLRDESPERFEALNAEIPRWFPGFDRVLFSVPSDNYRQLALRRSSDAQPVPASELSEGALVGLAVLTLSHLAEPPTIVFIEEPDRGIHPRLLRNVHEALSRLAFPEAVGDPRPPAQVIATTHSPYFLDLFSDHPERVAVAERSGDEAKFARLSDLPDVLDAVRDGASLGEVWFNGILGGVPPEA